MIEIEHDRINLSAVYTWMINQIFKNPSMVLFVSPLLLGFYFLWVYHKNDAGFCCKVPANPEIHYLPAAALIALGLSVAIIYPFVG